MPGQQHQGRGHQQGAQELQGRQKLAQDHRSYGDGQQGLGIGHEAESTRTRQANGGELDDDGNGVEGAGAIVVQFAAMGLSRPGRLGLLSYAEPLLTIAIAAVILGELLAPLQFLGALLVTAALVLLAWQPQANSQERP